LLSGMRHPFQQFFVLLKKRFRKIILPGVLIRIPFIPETFCTVDSIRRLFRQKRNEVLAAEITCALVESMLIEKDHPALQPACRTECRRRYFDLCIKFKINRLDPKIVCAILTGAVFHARIVTKKPPGKKAAFDMVIFQFGINLIWLLRFF